MSGLWVFKNGVVRLLENPSRCEQTAQKRKTLVHIPSGEAICSHEALEAKLTELGWERYDGSCEGQAKRQYHKCSSVDLISLPEDFAHIKSIHMYDLVVKNRDAFRVVDAAVHADDKADADQADA